MVAHIFLLGLENGLLHNFDGQVLFLHQAAKASAFRGCGGIGHAAGGRQRGISGLPWVLCLKTIASLHVQMPTRRHDHLLFPS